MTKFKDFLAEQLNNPEFHAEYDEYRQAQSDMRETVAVKANIDHLLGNTPDGRNKEQER